MVKWLGLQNLEAGGLRFRSHFDHYLELFHGISVDLSSTPWPGTSWPTGSSPASWDFKPYYV